MTKKMLQELAESKKFNLEDYDYYFAWISKGYINIELSVRCGIGICTPTVWKSFKLRCCTIDNRNAMGLSDYISWDYITEGEYLYIPEMK